MSTIQSKKHSCHNRSGTAQRSTVVTRHSQLSGLRFQTSIVSADHTNSLQIEAHNSPTSRSIPRLTINRILSVAIRSPGTMAGIGSTIVSLQHSLIVSALFLFATLKTLKNEVDVLKGNHA